MRPFSFAAMIAISMQSGISQATIALNQNITQSLESLGSASGELLSSNSTNIRYAGPRPQIDWIQYVSKALPEVDASLKHQHTQVHLMGVRVASSIQMPTFDLNNFLRTTMIFKAWDSRRTRWERFDINNYLHGEKLTAQQYGTFEEWGGWPYSLASGREWLQEDDQEFDGAQPIDWAAFAAGQGQGAALTPHSLISLAQQSTNPAVLTKVKHGPWKDVMIFNYAQPVAGLEK